MLHFDVVTPVPCQCPSLESSPVQRKASRLALCQHRLPSKFDETVPVHIIALTDRFDVADSLRI